MACSFGTMPSVLNILPGANVMSMTALVTIMDNLPMSNIMPFVMCKSPSNPTVAAATAAAMGVLTPMACVPIFSNPWSPGNSQVLIGGKAALTSDSMLTCAYGGVIKIKYAGTTNIAI